MVGLGQDILRSLLFIFPSNVRKLPLKIWLEHPHRENFLLLLLIFLNQWCLVQNESTECSYLLYLWVGGRIQQQTNLLWVICVTNLQIYKFITLQIYKLANLQIKKFTNLQISCTWYVCREICQLPNWVDIQPCLIVALICDGNIVTTEFGFMFRTYILFWVSFHSFF